MVLFVIFCPIVAAVLIMLGAPARKTALAASVLTFAVALFLFASLDRGNADFQHVTSFSISPEWRLSFTTGVDGLSVIMVLLASIVTLAAIWFAGMIERHENAFYACLLFISGGAIGAFASLNLFFFYAFHELALIPTFLLIGIWGSENRVAAAWKITIYLAIGSFILLLGLILLYQSLPPGWRSFDLRALTVAASLGQIPADAQRHIYLLLLIGFGILASLFPFHTWAPEAYASAPAPAAMLHAGVLKKFGLYGLLRLAIPLLPEGARHWATLLIVLLLGNIIYVGLVTIAQKRLDWMLGYSSVMHMGYIFLGIASGTLVGTTGAAILIFAHGISIALLFAFAGEVMVLFGTFRNGANPERFHIYQVATVLALWGVVISAVYMLRAYRAVFMGSLGESVNSVTDLRPSLRIPIALLVSITIWFGFFPQTFVKLVTPTFQSYFVRQ